ncbi:hypothetical protein BDZ91DRAFT_718433 [Kalaharituber pfeilii]|nr:hypothetical protein BDZ91DRAFT_718433 [Kalaharituber pfeilii]
MAMRIRNTRAAIVMLILEGISMSSISKVSPSGLARRLGLTCRLRKRMISMRA